MSQFIFDQIYGSQAKKRKIMSNHNFLYYRQMMIIKNKHITNPSLYSQLYTLPTYQQTSKPNKSQKLYSPDILATLNHNNYVIQKLNPHAFKIVKRKVKSFSSNKIKQKPFNMNIQRGYSVNSGRMLTPRTIDHDAKVIRNYLATSQQRTKLKTRLKNYSMDLEPNKTFRTYSRQKNSQYDTSAFSGFHQSTIDFKKN